jgi:hypothetical protein
LFFPAYPARFARNIFRAERETHVEKQERDGAARFQQFFYFRHSGF